jgi:5-methyltetrahydrofolate--homocysteine methyltransferase
MNDLRRQELYDALATRILIIDGAMGTMLQAHNPTLEDFGGPGLENCNENLCLTHPAWIADVHRAYLEAGADIIETNSFQGSPIVLAEFKLEDQTHEINVAADLSPDPWAPLRNRSRCAATSASPSCGTATTRRRAD